MLKHVALAIARELHGKHLSTLTCEDQTNVWRLTMAGYMVVCFNRAFAL